VEYNALIPELSVSNFKGSLAFYKALGFKLEYEREGFAFLSLGRAQLMIGQRNGVWETGKLEKPLGRGINFQIEVRDIRPLLAVLKKMGHTLYQAPRDNWYRVGRKELGNREFLVQDPDGYLLRFAQDLGER